MKHFYVVCALAIAASTACAQPRLLKDTNNESAGGNAASIREEVKPFEFNGRVYFYAFNATASQIFSTDGTNEGTIPLPSSELIAIYGIAPLGNSIIVSGMLSATGDVGIWKSDGTGPLELITPVAAYGPYMVMNDVLYFRASDPEHGYELWRTNGTEEGTYMVKDIRSGTASSGSGNGYQFSVVENTLYFVADDGVHGREMWKSDGTTEGTEIVMDINPNGNGIYYEAPFVVDNLLYFVADDGSNNKQFWKTDGTETNTVMVTHYFDNVSPSGALQGQGDKWITFDNGFDNGNNIGYEPFVLDISTGDYSPLKDLNPGLGNSLESFSPTDQGMIVFNDEIYFTAYGEDGLGLWKTDGTGDNTELATLINLPDGQRRFALTTNNDKIYLSTTSSSTLVRRLLIGDGESDFTTIFEGGDALAIIPFGDKVFLSMSDGIHGAEPWISDGTEDGTVMIRDLNTATTAAVIRLTKTKDRVIFQNTDGLGTYSLWGSDGTENGTILLTEGRFPTYFEAGSSGSKLIFNWDDKVHGSEPWITDGTLSGTFMLKDLSEDLGGSLTFNGLRGTWVGNTAFFFTNDTQLWKTDGTSEGTVLVTDRFAGQPHNIGGIVAMKNQAHFLFEGELWRSNGTEAGTVMIKDLATNSTVAYLVAGENRLFFSMDDGIHGYELWTSDGTAGGTHLVKDIHVATDDFYSVIPRIVINNIAYFWANEDGGYDRLWRSDGTEQGTYQLKDIIPGGIVFPDPLIWAAGHTTYLFAYDAEHGAELWKTDGTEKGTVMVKDINPNPGQGSDIESAVVLGDNLYFSTDVGTPGYEIWTSDGTESGTHAITNMNAIFPYAPNFPFPLLTTLGHKLFFTVNEPQYGREVWVYDRGPLSQTIDFEDIADKTIADSPFELVASASSGLPVTFEIVSGPATIDGAILTITSGGDINVKAIQKGDEDYSPASAEQSFHVQLVLGLEDINNSVAVFPNPATNTIGFVAPPNFTSLSLKDMLGRDVVSRDLTGEDTTIDVGHLPRGMYIVRLKSADQSTITRKIILR